MTFFEPKFFNNTVMPVSFIFIFLSQLFGMIWAFIMEIKESKIKK